MPYLLSKKSSFLLTMSFNLILVISIGIVSYLCLNNNELFSKLLFSPYQTLRSNQWYRFFSSAWVHGDFMHLAVNLYVMYSFGGLLESVFSAPGWFGSLGGLVYIGLFLLAVVIAHVPTYFKHRDNPNYNSVGASGGVSGVLFATILLFPNEKLLLFAIIPMNMLLFGVLYLGYTYWMSKNGKDNINHDAHLWGAIGGMAALVIIRPAVIPAFVEQLQGILS